jgi:heat-inducible transcriptional repressor
MLDIDLSNRQKLILKAIIEEYVSSGEPVGSKVLTAKPHLEFSSATIRADMAYLEMLGLLEKTHTSSGRIPSVSGYKYYVEHLVTRDYEVVNDFPLIDKIFNDETLNKEQMIKKAIDLLSDLTNYMTLASENNYEHIRIAKLDLVQISDFDALLLIITSTAKVETRQIKIPKMGFAEFKKVIDAFDKALHNCYVSEIKYILKSENVANIISQYIDYQDEILRTFEVAFSSLNQTKTFHSGIDTIFEIPEFRDVDKIKEIITAVNNESINSLIATPTRGLSVRIGHENNISVMNDCSIVSVPYQIGDDEAGMIAVIGPTRMEYSRVIPLLEYIAKNMSKLFK